VHEVHVARIALGIKRALDDERAVVAPLDETGSTQVRSFRRVPVCWETRNVPIFIDRMRLTGDNPARGAVWGLAGQEAVGTMLATPATRTHVESVRELVAHEKYAAVSLVDGVLVLRALAPQAEAVRRLFIAAWQRLRPGIVGREAVLPRIWST